MSNDHYNPNSIDAVLARMEARQIDNSTKLDAITDATEKQADRISVLENFKYKLIGAAIFAGVVVEWIKDLLHSK